MVRRILLIGLLVGVLAAVFIVWEGLALRRDLLQAQAEFDQALALADPVVADLGSFRDAQAVLQRSSAHLAAADRTLASADRRAARLGPLLALSAHLPGWLGGFAEVPPLITQARALAQTGLALSDGFNILTARLDEQQQGESTGARLSAGLSAAEPAFAGALTTYERATAARQSVRDERLGGPLASGARALATFDRRADTLGDAVLLLAHLPAAARSVLGMEGPRTYVILGQNSAELRPTGGFIGSMGVVTIDHGAITSEDYRSSYNFDNPDKGWGVLPAPMQAHLGPGWLAVRDANWSPDFPSTARLVEAFLLQHQGIKADGVIGFTTLTVNALMEALGPLQVEGFDQPLTAQNWYSAAEQRINLQDGERVFGDPNKEAVLEPMLRAILRRLQAGSLEDLPKVLRGLRQSVERRELQLYFHDPRAARVARRHGADGHLAPPAGSDVLALVDANLSYSKVGPYINQRILYDVWLSDRGVVTESRVTVEYENRITPAQASDSPKKINGAEWDSATQQLALNPGLYGTYARLYIPRNSRVLDVGDQDPPVLSSQELGFTTLERYYRVPAMGRNRFSYAYQIPVDLNPPGEYRLRVVKQPGTSGHALEVRVHLADGLTAASNLPLAREAGALVYRGSLITNLDLHLRLSGAAVPSR
jgi:hypothetical protein